MIVDENCKAREANDLHMTEYEQTWRNRCLQLLGVCKAQLVYDK
jgi:hypothetical protein